MGRINYYFLTTLLTTATFAIQAQDADSLRTTRLDAVVVQGEKLFTIERLPKVQATYLWSGKKNEVISVQKLDANITERTPRQIFSKVPGVFVYDMDGSGNQMNISTRGLDPHRGWEFNIRKNGIITNSDMYGYPASHYSMPMEAVERIEMVRGAGSLQYGAQFGGMLNYVSKKPDTTRAVAFESINAVGSFNTLSTYQAVGGKFGKFRYYAYYNKRTSDGYRENGHSDFDAQSMMLTYAPSKAVEITAEIARSKFAYKMPGPLTDSMFYADPRQSTRSRNYYSPDIFVPSLSLDWSISHRTRLSLVVSGLLGVRKSVMFNQPATVEDAVDPVTLQQAARVVDVDHYNSYTMEVRMLHAYDLGKISGVISGGVQLMNNDQHRQQLGTGTTGSDFDITRVEGLWGRDLHFRTKNVALFVENGFWITPSLVVSPGMRVELGATDMTGTINYYDPGEVPQTIEHQFPLFGVNAEYTFNSGNSLYGGWAQAYRPVIFQDVIPATTFERSDDNLRDARGYNVEFGFRGTFSAIRWDVSAFAMRYDNRTGTLQGDAGGGEFSVLRTNIGDAVTSGLEIFAEYPLYQHAGRSVTIFTSTALFKSKYINAFARSGDENIDISGNKIESVPDIISRNGISFRVEDVSVSALYSYTDESFADPLNTVEPSKSGSVGIVPEYGLLDINASWRIMANLLLRVNVSNVTDKQYFTKRPEFYPGPGVWSSDGRSFNCSIALTL
ncbi:MAG: TonB-dependent receptor [Bacteroidota bacterium]|nr:TonB-dependent receptor [Bacteroidota bacterium]